MAGAEPIYYWDTCLFLAWIKDEQRKTGEMDGVREVIERFKRREVKLITSTLTTVEVLQSRLPVGMERLFNDFMKRITRIGMDTKVAAMAHDIRDHYQRHSSQFGDKKLTTPDSIHLATAIMYRATEFHTFDDGGSGSKSIGLLGLSGNVGGHRLTICKPQAKNPQLDLRKP
ncbi:PIN domain-containing protein [Xanthobacter sp. KR7-225]|uniref:type II toxin-antitoxin system VapC family toxin n=1 Tax=Xanthobacter sp. KR7-225 TaxID=3156613 RepID=UPI0032B4DA70